MKLEKLLDKVFGRSGEACAGCGAVSPKHPMVGIGWDKKLARFRPYPVCALCHQDPRHRKVTLKMHFFPASRAEFAAARAGSTNIGG